MWHFLIPQNHPPRSLIASFPLNVKAFHPIGKTYVFKPPNFSGGKAVKLHWGFHGFHVSRFHPRRLVGVSTSTGSHGGKKNGEKRTGGPKPPTYHLVGGFNPFEK